MSELTARVKKIKNREKLSVRDYITMALMTVLLLVVYAIVGIPLSMTVVGNIFIHAICSLVWGTVFMLLFVRINKKWLPLYFGIVLGLLQLFNMWMTTIFIIVGAVIAEWIWQKWNREHFKTMVACFSVQITFWYLGNFIPLILIGNLEGVVAERYLVLYNGSDLEN